VLLKKASGASSIAFIKQGNSEDFRFDAADRATNISTTGGGTGSSGHQAIKYLVLMLQLLLSLEFYNEASLFVFSVKEQCTKI